LIPIPGKSAGEKQHWQAAKSKIGKNRAPKIPDGTGHIASEQSGGRQ
jgi:hypothetical protein